MRITAHVMHDHPNGQRLRAGLQFVVAPQDYDVTAAQLAEIRADSAIVVTKVRKDSDEAPAAPTKKELLAEATALGIEGLTTRTPNDDIAAAIAAKVAESEAAKSDEAPAAPVTRRAQGQTAADQQARDKRK